MYLTSFVSQDYDVAKGLNSHQQTFKNLNFPDKTILITLKLTFITVYSVSFIDISQMSKHRAKKIIKQIEQ